MTNCFTPPAQSPPSSSMYAVPRGGQGCPVTLIAFQRLMALKSVALARNLFFLLHSQSIHAATLHLVTSLRNKNQNQQSSFGRLSWTGCHIRKSVGLPVSAWVPC